MGFRPHSTGIAEFKGTDSKVRTPKALKVRPCQANHHFHGAQRLTTLLPTKVLEPTEMRTSLAGNKPDQATNKMAQ